MCDLIPIIEGPVKFREGKKWKQRFACVTRLSPVADSLTLQLWKDRKDWEKHPPSKGSIALEGYLGWEAGFTLDRESHTLAILLKSDIISLAFDNRETLIRWQFRVTSQFEEGQHFTAHLIQSKSKLNPGNAVKIHVQNRRFSMTSGVPPKIVHSWNLNDLRRFGSLENGRFCFEGGSRCGKGEGVHILRMDDPQDLQRAFEAATNNKLESKRKSMYKTPLNGSFSSHLDSISAAPSVMSVASIADHNRSRSRLMDSSDDSTSHLIPHHKRSQSREELLMTSGVGNGSRNGRSLSRCRNPSLNWSSTEGSVETMSVAISDLTEPHSVNLLPSPDHLVNRRDLLEKMGLNPGVSQHKKQHQYQHQKSNGSSNNGSDFAPQWSMDLRRPNSVDQHSVGSQESAAFPNYDIPKACTNIKEQVGNTPPALTPKKSQSSLRRLVVATPCACDEGQPIRSYENYDIPKHVTQDAMQFYDTPRALMQEQVEIPDSNTNANYDTPQQPLPVYKKPCGCIMKLVKTENTESNNVDLLWAYVQPNPTPEVVQQGSDAMPRAKLTGIGKMPVADLRNGLHSGHPQVTGLPPTGPQKSNPVYAMVNKAIKKTKLPSPIIKKSSQPAAHLHNYCNVSPLLGDVINKTPELFNTVQPDQVYASINKSQFAPKLADKTSTSQASQQGQQLTTLAPKVNKVVENTKNVKSNLQSNYLSMCPQDLPIKPFEYHHGMDPDDDPIDPISLRLQELQDALENEDDSATFAALITGEFNLSDIGSELPPPPPELLDFNEGDESSAKYLSNENIPENSTEELQNEEVGLSKTKQFDTMPRPSSKGQFPVLMRRSSSVPCKVTQSDRGSTSSSDSGFSPGSPKGELTA